MTLNTIANRDTTQGFTLVELVATIVLIGILAVTVLPKFTGRSGIVEYALRDQIISLLRTTQQRAMYDHSGSCYSTVINSNAIDIQKDGAQLDAKFRLALTGDYQGLSAGDLTIYFDANGNAFTTDCGSGPVGVQTITISDNGAATPSALQVHATGYVRQI